MRLRRLIAVIIAALVAGIMVYAIWKWDDGNGTVVTRLSDHILTLLSILGGIMVAVMAALGESSISGGKRFANDVAKSKNAFLKMGYVHLLFWLYLTAILAIMFSGPIGLINSTAGRYTAQIGVFFGIFSSLLSLGLPGFFLDLNRAKMREKEDCARKHYRDSLG